MKLEFDITENDITKFDITYILILESDKIGEQETDIAESNITTWKLI